MARCTPCTWRSRCCPDPPRGGAPAALPLLALPLLVILKDEERGQYKSHDDENDFKGVHGVFSFFARPGAAPAAGCGTGIGASAMDFRAPNALGLDADQRAAPFSVRVAAHSRVPPRSRFWPHTR